jgi:DeoR family transcriptional regulator of aga operon
MVQRSEEVTVVADATKLGRRSFATICDTASFQRLITDRGADAELVAGFEARGVEVVVV